MDPVTLTLALVGVLIVIGSVADSKCRKNLRQRVADLRLSRAETALVTRRHRELQQQFKERTVVLDQVFKQREDAEAKVKELQERDEHLTNEVNDLACERDNAREDLIAADNRRLEFETQLGVLRTTMEDLEANYESAITERNGFRDQLHDLRQKVGGLKREVAELKAEVERLEKISSWRADAINKLHDKLREKAAELRQEAVANDITGNVYGEKAEANEYDEAELVEEIVALKRRLANHEGLFARADAFATTLEGQIEDLEQEKQATVEQGEAATATIEGLLHRLAEARRRKEELEIAYTNGLAQISENVLRRPANEKTTKATLTRNLENEHSRAFWNNIDKTDAQILLLPQWQQDAIQKRNSK